MRRGGPRTGAMRTHAERLASRDGYFAPGSPIRRIGNTPLTPFLGGGPAVLLQVAHPLVAAGVVQHSDFRRDLWHRLIRTLGALYLITYGTKVRPIARGRPCRRCTSTFRARHGPSSGASRPERGTRLRTPSSSS